MTKKHLSLKNRHFEAVASNETDSSSNSTSIDYSNSTSLNSTSNSTDTSAASTTSDDSDTGLIVGLIFGGIALILLIAFGVWFYLRWKQKKIIKDYTMNPETFLAPQDLSIGQKIKLNQWSLTKDPKFIISDFTSKNVSTILGSFIQLNFSQSQGLFQSIIAHSPIDPGKENSYFEVEVDNLQNKETLIVIGFAFDTDYVKTFCPGTYPNSVGFQSCNEKSDVMSNNKSLVTFEFSVKFGETLGIGIRKDKRVWLSHNGQFLNPPAPSEKKLSEKELKAKEAAYARMDPEEAKEKKEKEAALEKEASKKKVTYPIGKKKFFPVIGCNGPCVLNLNIGGMPFRLFQKEIASGLL